MSAFETLNERIIRCTRCPRLVYFRGHAPQRKAFKDQTFWRKPVPGFGDHKAWLVRNGGLAPAAQGANRTGRIFTGDESARFLMRALYQSGFSNQPTSEARGDGLKLTGCYLAAAVKCVPSENRPLREEFENCSCYFESEFFLLKNIQAVLALGKMAFDAYQCFLKKKQVLSSLFSFGHAKRVSFEGWPTFYRSYHPSPQNTYTGKLKEKIFVNLLEEIKKQRA